MNKERTIYGRTISLKLNTHIQFMTIALMQWFDNLVDSRLRDRPFLHSIRWYRNNLSRSCPSIIKDRLLFTIDISWRWYNVIKSTCKESWPWFKGWSIDDTWRINVFIISQTYSCIRSLDNKGKWKYTIRSK